MSKYLLLSYTATALKIRYDTEHQKVGEKNPANSIVLKLQVIYSLVKSQNSYYPVSYGA